MTQVRSRSIVLASVVLMFVGGCHSTSKQNRNAAKERWAATRARILYSLAAEQLETGDLDKAETTIVEAMQTSPKQPEHYELAARIEIERGRLERAYHLLEKAVEFDPKRADSHYLLGVVLERWQRSQAALEAYEKAYELHPDDVTSLLAAAEMLVKLDRVEEAIHRLEVKATYFENNAALRVELGRMHSLRRQYDQAVRRFRQATVLSPEDPVLVEYLALAQCAAGRHADAIGHLETLVVNPKFARRGDLRLVLGDCYMATGRPVDARVQFMKAIEGDANDVNAWIKLGQAALIVGDTIRLERAVERTLALAPNRPEGHLLGGLVEQKAGRHETAVAAFDKAANLSPGLAEPLLLKGVSLERLGDRDGAAEAYQQALVIQPGDERIRRLLAGVGSR